MFLYQNYCLFNLNMLFLCYRKFFTLKVNMTKSNSRTKIPQAMEIEIKFRRSLNPVAEKLENCNAIKARIK